jgi:hypothetical protein
LRGDARNWFNTHKNAGVGWSNTIVGVTDPGAWHGYRGVAHRHGVEDPGRNGGPGARPARQRRPRGRTRGLVPAGLPGPEVAARARAGGGLERVALTDLGSARGGVPVRPVYSPGRRK